MALHEQDRFGNLVAVNFLSRLTFSWVNKTLQHGNRAQLQEKDLLELPDNDSTETLVDVLDSAWTSEEHLQGANPDKNHSVLLRALFKSFRFQLSILVLLMLFDLLLRILIAVLVGSFVEHLDAVSNTRAFVYSGLLGGLTMSYGVVRNHFMSRLHSLGTQVKTSITGLIYKKVLMLNQKSLYDVTPSHVTRLVSLDCASIQSGSFFLPYLVIFPLEVLTITALSWYHISWLSLFATCLVVSLVPVQTGLRRLRSRFLYSIKGLSSERMNFMSKIVTGIKMVKMNVWEKAMFRMVDAVRRNEVKLFQKIMVFLSCQNTIQLSCLTVISIVTFPSLVYLGEGISPVKVFSTLALYTCLVQSALEYVSCGIESIPQAIAAAQNVEQFLQLEDLHSKQDIVHCRVVGNSRFFVNAGFDRLGSFKSSYPSNILSFNTLANQNQSSDAAKGAANQHDGKQISRLCFQGASFSWSIKRQLAAISDISLELDDDVILGVTGPSDSGKTALLLATLHELPLSQGNVTRAGRTVYVPQVPWVFTGSLRDNILCDSPFAEDRYWKVMNACALDKDILEFPNGDLTMIGEGGVSLSTDQRTRVSLARAAYCEADIYLFDDNLSYLDNKTSEGLVTRLIAGVLSHTCRVIVTNNEDILSQCSHVIVMESGRVKHKGTFSKIKEHITNSRNRESGDKPESRDKNKHESSPPIMMSDSEIFTDDVFPVGVSNWSVYWRYLRASPGMCVLLLLLLVVTGQGCMVVTDWWLARWCSMDEDRQTDTRVARTFYGIATVSIIMAFLKSLCLFFTFLKTSDRLHGRMLRAVLKAHISFFDTNSPTRILHRFSKDTHDVDIALPYAVNDYIKSTMFVFSVVIVSIAVNYWLAVACVPLLPLSICLRRYALRSTRDLNKLKRSFDSDVAAHFDSTLSGLTCIRAFNMQRHFLIDVYRLLNNFTRANVMHSAGLRWLCLREEIVCSVFILVICIAAVLSKTNPGYAGLALVYAIQMFFYIQWIVIATAETDSLMSSFSRILSYTSLEPEHGYNNKHHPPKDWPQEGGVKCEDLSYENESQETLNTTYLDISAKEHVVIIGQKNSGTSSLINALFRMPEPKGRVIIDHVNLNQLSLRHARRAIGIVPRYPKLFSTFRCNLDPYDRHSDEDIWQILEGLDLKSKIVPLAGSELDLQITARLTTTELRLIALAHAFLENKKILIIEEKPEDEWSNKQINDVIQEHFQDCTVITIAQRLGTIMGSDRVLVMRNGCVTEFDRPSAHSSQNDDELMDIIGQALSF